MSGDGDTVDVELVDEHLGESVLGEGPVEPGQLVEGLHQAGGAEDDSDDQPRYSRDSDTTWMWCGTSWRIQRSVGPI